MKSMNRNKIPIVYALQTGYTERAIDGVYTGEKTLTYGNSAVIRASVSASRGSSDVDIFGVNIKYTNVAIVDGHSCPIAETSRLWLAVNPNQYSPTVAYSVGDICLRPNGVYKCVSAIPSGEQWTSAHWNYVPHTHEVVRVAKSINNISYALQEVEKT